MERAEFESIVSEVMESLPPRFASAIENVDVFVEDWPTPEQRARLHLHRGETLFGLYEGIPITQRSAGYHLAMPDRITIFRGPIEQQSEDPEETRATIQHTVIHEVAHFFGISDERLVELGAY